MMRKPNPSTAQYIFNPVEATRSLHHDKSHTEAVADSAGKRNSDCTIDRPAAESNARSAISACKSSSP
jgi:hypothetical protein